MQGKTVTVISPRVRAAVFFVSVGVGAANSIDFRYAHVNRLRQDKRRACAAQHRWIHLTYLRCVGQCAKMGLQQHIPVGGVFLPIFHFLCSQFSTPEFSHTSLVWHHTPRRGAHSVPRSGPVQSTVSTPLIYCYVL